MIHLRDYKYLILYLGAYKLPGQSPEIDLHFKLMTEYDETSKLLEHRSNCIISIESDMSDINDIVKSLNILVNTQGAELDTIESHMGKTYTHVVSGNVHLKKASKYQVSKRGIMCYLLLLLILVVAIIVIAKELS